MPVGAGRVDLYGWITGTSTAGGAGAGVTYEHRVSPAWSLFGTGRAGRFWDESGSRWGYDGVIGARAVWGF